MRRMLLAAAAILVSSAAAQAQWNQPPAPSTQGPAPQSTAGMYGWNPCFKSLIWWKKDSGPSGCGPKGCGPQGYTGAAMPGTLVFPQNPYIRSPRDFFMYDAGK